MEKQLLMGFGRADMTPPLGVQLTGYGNDDRRPAQNVLDPLYATCLAFTDERGETALVYTMDILYAPDWVRPAIAEAVGLDVGRIHISAIHTHAGPVYYHTDVLKEARHYQDTKLTQAAIQAAKDALADRKPVEMSTATTYTERLNFVRHYLMEDGTYSGPNFGNRKIPIKDYESPADNALQLVKFSRVGGKDVLLANFQVHQTDTGGMPKLDISADIAGAMRAKMERETDCLFAYFTGACGNVNPTSRIEKDKRFSEEEYAQHGQALADCALAALKDLRPIAGGSVQVRNLHLEAEVNHSLDHLADKLIPINEIWRATGDRPRCNALAQELGLNSVYAVESALAKMKLGKTLGIDIAVITAGELAFAIVPYEMFDTNGMEVKNGSPFATTIVATCSDMVQSYIPSKLGFEHGGYSCDRCRFVPGTAEMLSGQYVRMLTELHQSV